MPNIELRFPVSSDDRSMIFALQMTIGSFNHSVIDADFLAFGMIFEHDSQAIGGSGKARVKGDCKPFVAQLFSDDIRVVSTLRG
jgi:hypothetical protein